jgi:outer membrane protein assembly factor BamE (lipoprotein component of BamABCDE complex)
MKAIFSALIVSGFLILSACSPNVETRGHVQISDWKQSIVAGTSTRDDVLGQLGSPSTRSSFGEETWYYVTTKRESFAFFKPEITDQEVVAVAFDAGGVVSSVKEVGRDAMREDVEFSSRKTPTEGHSMTFIEQLLGNAGRFNRPDSSGTISPGSNRPGGRR